MKYLAVAFLFLFSVSSFAESKLTCPMFYELPDSESNWRVPNYKDPTHFIAYGANKSFVNICNIKGVGIGTRTDGLKIAYVNYSYVVGVNAQKTYDEGKKIIDLLNETNVVRHCNNYKEVHGTGNNSASKSYTNICKEAGGSKGIYLKKTRVRHPGRMENGKYIPGYTTYNYEEFPCEMGSTTGNEKGCSPAGSYEKRLAEYPRYIPSEH